MQAERTCRLGPGRPTSYTPELAAEICTRLAESETLEAICADDHMPVRSTVHLWVVEDREGFSDMYAKARAAQAYKWAEEILTIADRANADVGINDEGEMYVRGEVVARSRLRVDTRKWLLSKVLPKLYGDKLALTGGDGGPIELHEVTDEALAKRASALVNRLQPKAAHRNGTKP